jgi:hypothetical protein
MMSQLSTRLAFATLLLAACAGRQTAATQASPAAFDAAKSDPKAVALADQALAALGGEAAWTKAKEISWSQAIVIDGKLVDASTHAWDRWNGRHRYGRVSPAGTVGVTMHDLFEATSYAFTVKPKGGENPVSTADKTSMVDEAKRRFETDVYPFTIHYRLKDPGVHLKLVEERPAEGAPPGSPMKTDVLELTFDPGVGPSSGDTWYVVVDKVSHLPVQVEHHVAGKPDIDRQGFTLEEWIDVGGLKFAGKRVTLDNGKPDRPKSAMIVPPEWANVVPFKDVQVPNPGELVLVTDVKVNAEPTEDLYVPQVQ